VTTAPSPVLPAAEARPEHPDFLFPRATDVRWHLLAFQISYVVYALVATSFSRTVPQYVAAFASCMLLDFALSWTVKGVRMFPLSGLITSMGTILILDSPLVWPYAFVGVVAMLSKHFLRVRGRHIFNPNNAGLVLAVLYFPGVATASGGGWGGYAPLAALMFALGASVAYRAGRLPLALAYWLTFAAGVLVRSAVLGQPPMMVGGPMTGPAFQLFLFYMLTDPMTTPQDLRGQIVFGCLLGTVDTVLRFEQQKYAPLYALFIMTAFYASFAALTGRRLSTPPWKWRRLTAAA